MKGIADLSTQRPLTVIDVGANVGCFSLFMASRYPLSRIISFEPMKENFQFLSQNFQKNLDKDLTCIPEAVFGHTGKINLKYIPEENFPTRASIFKYQSHWDEIEVNCISIPDILKRFDINAILMVSSEYSHSMAAVDIPGAGARFPYKDKKYLVAEMTKDVAIGQINAEMADPAKWLGIEFK